MRTIFGNDRNREANGVIYLARRKRWEGTLVPQADVDNGVRKVNLLDVVDDVFFLQGN